MKFKAAILEKLNNDLVIDQIEFNQKLSFGQVLVKIAYSGVCGSQIGEINGIKGKDPFLPHLLGHEGVGEVLEISRGVKNFRVGDRVILHWKPSKGIQSKVPSYKWGRRKVNAGWVTTFNEMAVVSENRLTKIKDNTDFLDNVLYGCAILTGYGVVENDAKIKKGENVLVFGAGGIGLNIIQAAKLSGAKNIYAVDRFKNRLNFALKLGANKTLLTDTVKFKTIIKKLKEENLLDVFIDNTGNTNIIELGYDTINSNGRLILVGVPKYNEKIKIHTLPIHFGKKIIGSHGGGVTPHLDIPRYKKIIKKNKIQNKKLISKIYNLDDINLSIKDMTSKKIKGRVIIKYD